METVRMGERRAREDVSSSGHEGAGMNLQGQSEFSVASELTLDEVVEVANEVLREYVARTPTITRAWADRDEAGDVRVQITTVSSSYAHVEREMDALARVIAEALQERRAGTQVSRGATELVPA